MNRVRSDYLFATPSFMSGAGRVLDLYGVYDCYNSSSTEREADYNALLSDWYVVGQDLFDAMTGYGDLHAVPLRDVVQNDEHSDDRQLSFFQ